MTKTKRILLAPALILPLGLALAQDHGQGTVPAAAAKDDPALQKIVEYSTPGPAHEVLGSKIGKWNTSTKLWLEPGGQPESATGTAERSWILDNRFVEEHFAGTLLGSPFQGRGTTGYDNIKEKYVTSWVDSMSTGIMACEGSFDPATKTFNYVGQSPDPLSGRYVPMRFVEKIEDGDHWTLEMFVPGPDGTEYKSMEITYKRAK